MTFAFVLQRILCRLILHFHELLWEIQSDGYGLDLYDISDR